MHVLTDLLIEKVSVLFNVIGQEVGLRADQKNVMAQWGIKSEVRGGSLHHLH